MEGHRVHKRLCILGLYLCIVVAISFTRCDARKSAQRFRAPTHSHSHSYSHSIRSSSSIKGNRKTTVLKGLDMLMANSPILLMDSASNTQPYGVSSPFFLPPFDSLAPIPLPENAPPFCVYPPFTPQTPPSTTIPTPTYIYPPPSTYAPILPIQSPPPSPPGSGSAPFPNPPPIFPAPPAINVPSPPEYIPNPPVYIPSPTEPLLSPPYSEPTPPSYELSPPFNVPSPTGFVPSPPVFQPPVVYPPPTGPPPPPHTGPSIALWCVAKASVPEPIIEEAMNYACGSGADCDSIQPNGSCFEPNTLFAHASYAFNSYWQRTKVAGGTCEFGGTAMLVTVDPSYDGCHFVYN